MYSAGRILPLSDKIIVQIDSIPLYTSFSADDVDADAAAAAVAAAAVAAAADDIVDRFFHE